ncbi:glycosyl hydrolase [Sinomonas gamaensis]|uniref:glycosyl hydrolase n=1 Tax=Sinomonas gamaensis TaxID=2565624 RepID=UPI001107D316|nr:glycosyl hydrolase [Sinomonas gamaensis]
MTAAALGLILLLIAGCVAPEPETTSAPAAQRPTAAPPILDSENSSPALPPAAVTSGALTTDELVIDAGSRQQIVSGLGIDANVHSWKGGQLKPAIDAYSAWGPLTWRVIIEKSDWESAQVGDPNAIDWAYYNSVLTSPKLEDLWDTIAYIESKPGQTVSLSLMGGVPAWMGGTHILPDKEDYWVRMVASLVGYAREKRGLKLNLLSPLNEPDLNGIEGPKVDPDQTVRLFDKLGHRLESMGLGDVKFVAPDASSVEGAKSAYAPLLMADPYVRSKIAHLGVHTYSGDLADLPSTLKEGDPDVWVTEFNTACDSCDSGVKPDDSWNRATSTASILLSLLEQGASGAQLYDAWDGFYEHHGAFGYWGALAYDAQSGTYIRRQTFEVLKLLYRYLPPGFVRVRSHGASAVTAVAFADPRSGALTIVGVNGTSSSQRFRISDSSARSAFSTTEFSALTDDGVTSSPQPLSDASSLTVSVPPDSVFAVSAKR